MTKIVFVLIFVLHTICGAAQPADWSHKACIWRGMRHSWTYNHRCNRMGDYVEKKADSFYVVHTSATGKGADSTFYDSYYTTVESPDVWFNHGSSTSELFGLEGALLEETVEVMVPLPEEVSGAPFMTALINGFDISSLGKADKLQMFNVRMEKPEILPEQKKIRLLIKIAMVDNCQTLECERFNNKTEYSVTIHYLMIYADKQNISENQDFSSRNYTWDKKIINGALTETRIVQGTTADGFKSSAIGIQSFGFALNKAHWLVEFDNNVQPHEYKPSEGTYEYDVEQSFVEWEEGMRKFSAVPEQSRFAVKQKGWITMNMDVVLLQFRRAKIAHGQVEGTMYWIGKNGSATNTDAICTTQIR